LQSGIEIPYVAVKANIADSLNMLIQIDRRPGIRFVSEVLKITGFDVQTDTFQYDPVYSRGEPMKKLNC
jgi:hypothetical protein